VRGKEKPLVSIVVPSWNGWWLLEDRLPGLLAAARETGRGEVVVVDDASEDGTQSKLERFSPALRVVRLEKQSGFPVAAHRGVEAAKGEYIFLVNNDVVVPPGVLGSLLEGLEDPGVFAVVPRIVRSDTGVDESKTKLFFRRGIVATTLAADEQLPDFACGAAVCFRRSVYGFLGGFDPLFAPFYWEDVDLSYRARKRGFLIKRVGGVAVSHQHSKTIGTLRDRSFVQRVYERNRLFFMWKNITDASLWRKHLAWLPLKLAWDAIAYRDFLHGFVAALKRFTEVAARRRQERRECWVSDAQLLVRGGEASLARREP